MRERILAAYATAWLLDAPTLPTRAALRAALDASRASRLSVSERCCSSNCCACQVKANHIGMPYICICNYTSQ